MSAPSPLYGVDGGLEESRQAWRDEVRVIDEVRGRLLSAHRAGDLPIRELRRVLRWLDQKEQALRKRRPNYA